MDIRDTIAPTAAEQHLFDTLLAASAAAGRSTTLRVAGGWVRDKLMGRESHDIDIALDDISGVEFAELVHRHLQATGESTSRVSRIQANPDQSKHLETATMKVCNMQIDFVNLRSEKYAEGSRIPTIVRGRLSALRRARLTRRVRQEIGTPEEDALRRDLTINALFYNINSRAVEDFTGRGMQDLRAGIVRTPLPPLTTFLDDPLRVLRTIRFATRYGFAVDPDLASAAATPHVREALAAKVSRERVGKELLSTLAGPRPSAALFLLHSLSLWDGVFTVPGKPTTRGDPARSVAILASAARAFAALTGASEPPMPGVPSFSAPPAPGAAVQDVEAMSFRADVDAGVSTLLLAAALAPVAASEVPIRKGRVERAPRHIILNALKAPLRVADGVEVALEHAPAAADLALGAEPDRLRAGLFVRSTGRLWPASLLVGLAARASASDGAAVAQAFSSFAHRIREWRLADIWREKPLLNVRPHHTASHFPPLARDSQSSVQGKRLIVDVGVPKGPPVGRAMERVIEWQIINRDGTADDCAAYIRALGSAAYEEGPSAEAGAAT